MPVKVRRLGHGRARVTDAGKVTAKNTSVKKAKKQANLLRGVAHGWHPTRGK